MGKRIPVWKIVSIAKAMDELRWYSNDKWSKKIVKQLRKKLRKGA